MSSKTGWATAEKFLTWSGSLQTTLFQLCQSLGGVRLGQLGFHEGECLGIPKALQSFLQILNGNASKLSVLNVKGLLEEPKCTGPQSPRDGVVGGKGARNVLKVHQAHARYDQVR